MMIYAPRITLAQAAKLAEKIRQQVHARSLPDIGQISISCGVAMLRMGDSLTQLLHRADQALYEAKQAGRNQVAISAAE